MTTKTIRVTCDTKLRIPLDQLHGIQGKLKTASVASYVKFRRLIEKRGINFSLHVWKEIVSHAEVSKINKKKKVITIRGTDPVVKWWVIDGHLRRIMLAKMREDDGFVIPDVPCVEIEATDYQDAKRQVLAASSSFHRISGDGLYEFAADTGMGWEDLEEYELTDIDMVEFKTEFFEDAETTTVSEHERQLPGGGTVDEVPNPPKVPVTKPGDLWLLGNHRLLCGDCTVPEDVKRVMNGERAALMNTDPPYGVSYTETALSQEGGKWEEIANDNLRDEKLQDFLTRSFRNAADLALRRNAAWYLWHAHLTQAFFAAAAAAAKVILHRQIIWVKQQLILGRGMYHWKHEPCFMGWQEGHRPEWYSDRKQTTCWDLGPRETDRLHPTQKPVLLFEIPIMHHTLDGEWVYEPFAGSGSQILAAEKKQRCCAALEISPAYCDVIVERWERLTGRKAVKENPA